MTNSDRTQLEQMGFESNRIDWAYRVTGNSGLEAILTHLLEHSNQPIPSLEEQQTQQEVHQELESHQPNSILCTDCGKRFRNQAYAEFHAEKSGHTSFEESTESLPPLTEEEKQIKLNQMRQNLAQKRAQQAKLDQEEQKKNEVIRRKAGQESNQAKEELQNKQRLREAQQKQRERQEDFKAKQRVLQQIEADKRERLEKARLEKARREGKLDEVTTLASGGSIQSTNTNPKPSSTGSKSTSNASEARLRIRLNNGQMWQGTISADSTLLEVEQRIVADGKCDPGSTISLSTTFPRKVFTDTEKGCTLRELGLVPNAALEGHITM